MARLIFKDNITSGGALAVGQTLRLGGFIMAARSASAPTMTSRVIKNSLHVNSKLAEQMDPMELSSLNELLDRIAALGVATDHDRIGLKPDQRDIKSPPVTHEIAVVEEPHIDSLYLEDELCLDYRALSTEYPFTGGHDPKPELRIGRRAEKIGQHPRV